MKINLKFKIKNLKLNGGFTLIELLTVISIIGVMTAFLTVSFIGVRQRGRDAQRKSNIKQIQSALELYRADTDSYPTTAVITALTCGNPFVSGSVTYMSKFPCDPSTGNKFYYSQTTATSYVIASCLENTNDKDGTSAYPGLTCNPLYYYVSQNP